MKYEVSHSVLTSPSQDFKRGEVVTSKQLTDAGFDVDFLLKNEAIEALRGTELDDEPAVPSKIVSGSPHLVEGQPHPKNEGKARHSGKS